MVALQRQAASGVDVRVYLLRRVLEEIRRLHLLALYRQLRDLPGRHEHELLFLQKRLFPGGNHLRHQLPGWQIWQDTAKHLRQLPRHVPQVHRRDHQFLHGLRRDADPGWRILQAVLRLHGLLLAALRPANVPRYLRGRPARYCGASLRRRQPH